MGTFTRFWVWQQLTEFCILNLVCHRHLLEATFEFCLAFLQPTTGILLGEEFPVLWVLYGKHCWKVQNPYFSLLCRQGQTCGLSLTNTVTLDMDYMPGTHKARPAHPALGGRIGRGAQRRCHRDTTGPAGGSLAAFDYSPSFSYYSASCTFPKDGFPASQAIIWAFQYHFNAFKKNHPGPVSVAPHGPGSERALCTGQWPKSEVS